MRLAVGNRAETIASLRNHDVDIALMGRPPKDVPVRASAFGDHPLVIIAPPDHPMAAARDISKERIAEEHFLIREPGSGTRISLEIFLADVPGRIDDLGIEMGSNETIKQAVMAGLGIAFISAHTIASEVEAGRLVILDVVGMPIRRQWFAVMRVDHAISPAMATFHDFLMRKARHICRWWAGFIPTAMAHGDSELDLPAITFTATVLASGKASARSASEPRRHR